MGQRKLHRAFADDLALATETRANMQIALTAVEDFCQWSGMRVNASKSEASGWDFRRKLALDTISFMIDNVPLTPLDPATSNFTENKPK